MKRRSRYAKIRNTNAKTHAAKETGCWETCLMPPDCGGVTPVAMPGPDSVGSTTGPDEDETSDSAEDSCSPRTIVLACRISPAFIGKLEVGQFAGYKVVGKPRSSKPVEIPSPTVAVVRKPWTS